MENETAGGLEFKKLAERIELPLDDEIAEKVGARYSGIMGDAYDVMREMMKKEYDDIFPASVVSL